MSEPYSEELAEEAARRLLEFGDDYRNFLDSQSDCASSLSANHPTSPIRRRRPTVNNIYRIRSALPQSFSGFLQRFFFSNISLKINCFIESALFFKLCLLLCCAFFSGCAIRQLCA